MSQVDGVSEFELIGLMWSRAGFESLAHAKAHASGPTESDRRVALHSIDGAIESLITGFLRQGPGADDTSNAAVNARGDYAKFREKRDYVFERANTVGMDMPVSKDDFQLVRSVRNSIQHSAEWVVPDADRMTLGFDCARATCAVLDCLEFAGHLFPAHEVSDANVRREFDYDMGPAHDLTGRSLAEAAWEVSREADPDKDGLHVRVLEERLAFQGVVPANERSLYDALNHAHDLFDSFGGAVWGWKEPARDVHVGIYGRPLADLIEALLRTADPNRTGMHPGEDMIPLLDRWQVPIRGQDRPATIRSALDRDGRFAKTRQGGGPVRTRYRLRGAAGTEGGGAREP